MWYIRVPYKPCFVLRSTALFLNIQPQDFVPPLLRQYPRTTVSLPQSHLHFQYVFLFEAYANPITVSIPKRIFSKFSLILFIRIRSYCVISRNLLSPRIQYITLSQCCQGTIILHNMYSGRFCIVYTEPSAAHVICKKEDIIS